MTAQWPRAAFICYFADPFAKSLNLAVIERLMFPIVRRNGVCLRGLSRKERQLSSRRGACKARLLQILPCALKMPHIASQVLGGNQDAKMDHLLQRDHPCSHSSINSSRGFRYGMGSNRSTASAAAI
jgi:hypothetical protein